ncbi:vWA domain-containing protein, partial [uncultured Abyssibacter sp.]|uniref:vWA domain-containing protein n=1 Tax=uncultured Abyssibacter sp. TaxID=2320202 RepID=UPI0032B10DBC
HRFSQDASSLANFIDRLEAQGGTPLASAIEAANRYLKANASSTPSNRAIILLADGKANEGCDQITNVLDKLDSDVSLYKHETVGLEIDPFSTAASQLKEVASRTGGEYHHAANARSLDDSLDKAIQGLSLVKLIGQFE